MAPFLPLWVAALQVLTLSSTVSATRLPIVGPVHFDVITTSVPLTDANRLDPFAKDGRSRSIMASGYYPVSACRRKHQEPYMPTKLASLQDKKFGAYGLPNGTFGSLTLETCDKIAKSNSCFSKPLPLVLFSGALGTSRLLYNSMLQSVAAAGYLVISVDHPYDADFVEFPDGTVITGVDISDEELESALTTRVEDIAFLYQQLGGNSSLTDHFFPGYPHRHRFAHTAIVGHSFGGAAAAAAMLQIPSLRGGMNLDGTMFGPVITAGLDRPFVLLGHDNKTQETDPSWKATWPRLTGWKKEYEVRGSEHYGFSDLPLITSVLGFQKQLPNQVLGSVEGRRMMKLTVTYVTAFLDFLFKSGSETKLEHASKDFPEVVQVA
ncbi:PAF acetylhydrolase family protein [Cucurbitaria berberidis CBS 394.84]|uniref:1-alkyl-2-acetylglycerophosphocholine esterase n=1 Tax=Cucurbitaria berberidis CBS 394.84 TaxID=1168544 RepID=A0A9P4GBR2_9PLEO|nr:PAF acetylhydrolase family protein [Cucurbitaria berberidis CBS 394.84]KAF1842502.1 PAF acetylhydrolase family protein [Cucurbitaria berberidis CBS 394.84]